MTLVEWWSDLVRRQSEEALLPKRGHRVIDRLLTEPNPGYLWCLLDIEAGKLGMDIPRYDKPPTTEAVDYEIRRTVHNVLGTQLMQRRIERAAQKLHHETEGDDADAGVGTQPLWDGEPSSRGHHRNQVRRDPPL